MSFRDLRLKSSYSSANDDILTEFYIPTLSNAVQYDRIAGFFTSASLSYAARGIAGLITNNGKMRLITSPCLKEEDIHIIESYINGSSEDFENFLIGSLDELTDFLSNEHLKALFWLLAHNRLEIKIAIPINDSLKSSRGIMHMKVGILKDKDGKMLSFSGSVNETSSAWSQNSEEFKVFMSDIPGQDKYFEADLSSFNCLWNNMAKKVQVFDLPESVKESILIKAPNDIGAIIKNITNSDNNHGDTKKTPYEKLGLFDNQQKAVDAWFANDHKGIFAMATGTGKTRTAVGCIIKCIEQNEINLIVVSAPQNTILRQWVKEIKYSGLSNFRYCIADSSNPKWKNDLLKNLMYSGFISRFVFFIFTTHRTLSSDHFIALMRENALNNTTLLVCDEVHGIGARKSRHGLIEEYNYRLGLSATPTRWFDDYGSSLIFKYFGKIVYDFHIKEALLNLNPLTGKPYLKHYKYYPIFVKLSDEEVENYKKLTNRIVQLSQRNQTVHEDDYLEILMYKRADIHKKAFSKLEALNKLLEKIQVDNTIIFTCDQHMIQVMDILNSHNITYHSFTENEGNVPVPRYSNRTEREEIIRNFVNGNYSVLIAIKCLDEGVDIPSAEQAILMTSSSNPREYIQRIGRVIRQYDKKREARIYDMIVIPNTQGWDHESRTVEKKILDKELERAMDIARNASNRVQALENLFKVKEEK